jgi:GT2 family glycosyltransferase
MIEREIIIPTYNQSKYTIKCLKSIKKYTKNYKIIWIDNGSIDYERNEVEYFLKEEKIPYTACFLKANLGFVLAINQGMRIANSDNVYLLNNDTEVCKNWCEGMEQSHFDIVGPVTDNKSQWQYYKNFTYIKSLTIGATNPLSFFCVLLRRKVIDKIGFLSPDYGFGFGDDDDYCARAKMNGFKIGIIKNVLIKHNFRTTFKSIYSREEIKKMQDRNMQVFRIRQMQKFKINQKKEIVDCNKLQDIIDNAKVNLNSKDIFEFETKDFIIKLIKK